MIAASPFSFRSIVDRLSLAPTRRCGGRVGSSRTSRVQRIFAALGEWSAAAPRGGRRDILLRGGPERFRGYCRDCGDQTPHEGSDELGAGWYAQISRCRHCGCQTMRVWPFSWW